MNQFWRCLNYLVPPFALQFWKFFRPKFFVIHDSGVLSEESWNLYKLKRGGPNFLWEPILQNVWIMCSALLFFNFESFLDPNSSSFISFQCILHDSGVLLSGFSNLYKLSRGELISPGNRFCRMSEIFGPPFCFLILKVF